MLKLKRTTALVSSYGIFILILAISIVAKLKV